MLIGRRVAFLSPKRRQRRSYSNYWSKISDTCFERVLLVVSKIPRRFVLSFGNAQVLDAYLSFRKKGWMGFKVAFLPRPCVEMCRCLGVELIVSFHAGIC